MATNIYGAIAINGGTSGSMDSLKYDTLADGDLCIVTNSDEDFAVFRFESSSSTSESSPWTTNKVVAPDDVGVSNGRWILADQIADDLTVYGTLTLSGAFSVSSFTTSGDITMGDAASIAFDDIVPASDHNVVGLKSQYTAGENLVFGNFCYLKSDGKMWKADADASTTMPCLAMAAATITADDAGDFLEWGWARDDSWSWTVGSNLYVSTTAGALTHTAPSSNGDQVQFVGIATHADRIRFNPTLNLIEVTA